MAPTTADWLEYDRWSDALEHVLFPQGGDANPVYLDLEDAVLDAVAVEMGISSELVEEELCRVVAASVDVEGNRAFRAHRARLRSWSQRTVGSFPLLPLLAVFSLAAERMTHGDGMAASNYYGRLADALGGESNRIAKGYREVAELFWSSLNRWLDDQQGDRGTPTAYSVGFRFVGLSISQALVREADRRRLKSFFLHFDLPPRGDIPPAELEPLLDAWISRAPAEAGAHLSGLWKKAALQPRIAEVTAVELAGWGGEESADVVTSKGRVLLSLELNRFPRRKISMFPLFYSNDQTARTVTVATDTGDQVSWLDPFDGGTLRLRSPHEIEGADALEGVIELRDAGRLSYERRPQRLVVFRLDELSARWLETKQVLLGDDLTLLVQSDFVRPVTELLEQVARPGWTSSDEYPGLPKAWHVITDVEIFARSTLTSTAISELNALTPLTSNHLKLAGGIALGGRVKSWHSASPPEARAITDSGLPFEIVLMRVQHDFDGAMGNEEVARSEAADVALIWDLNSLGLLDGSYAVEMVDQATGTTRSRKEFSLRSGSSPDLVAWSKVSPIVHDLAHPLAVVCADVPDEEFALRVQGVLLDSPHIPASPLGEAVALPWWSHSPREESTASLSMIRPDAGSCFYTGRHHEDLERVELDSRGRPVERAYSGRCRYCGQERKYSSSYIKNMRQHERRLERSVATAPSRHAVDLPRIVDHSGRVDWDVALDCLRFAGGGPISSLYSLARQFDGGGLFASEFVRTLESLGHIELQRRAETFEVIGWEICPSTILDMGDERLLTGYWSELLETQLRRGLENAGFGLAAVVRPGAPKLLVSSAPAHLIAEVAEGDVAISDAPGDSLAAHLSSLGAVLAAIPRQWRLPTLGVESFDLMRTCWVQGADVHAIGAYRTSGYKRTYFIRTDADLARGTIAVVDAYLAKHAASLLLSGRALFAHDKRSRELICPLGADLPGMYGRAVVLSTGQPPSSRREFIIYRGVSELLANRIAYLMEN